MTLQESTALLAGLSFLTVLNLKHSEDEHICVTHSGPDKNGKYRGFITTIERRPVINTEPVFDTASDAESHMRLVISAAREWEPAPSTAEGAESAEGGH